MKDLRKILGDSEKMLEEAIFQDGDVIFKDGDDSQEFYFIQEGRVKIVKQIHGGGMKVLAVLEQGDVFGERALLSDEVRGASAIALSEVKLQVLSAENFQGMLADNPKDAANFLLKVIEVVNERLAYVNSELVTLYDMTRILSGAPDDLGMVAHDVIKKFMEVSQAEEGAILLHNVATEKEDVLAVSDESRAEFVQIMNDLADDRAAEFSTDLSRRFIEEEKELLWVPIRNYQGKYLGMVVLRNVEGEFTDGERKLVASVADQLATAVERHYSKESDKEKVRLKQQMVSGL